MRYKVLGKTGLRVSELCMGAMTFGGSGATWEAIGGLDQQQSTELVARALDAGINFFDTADAYGGGESETFLGRALGLRRRDVVVASKAGFPMGAGPNDRGLSRVHLLEAVEGSLRRLNTDYIDLYLVHTRDAFTPLEETMQALDDIVRSGKARYLGISNFPAWEIVRANAYAEHRNWGRFECAQLNYNLAARDIEREHVPMLLAEKIGLMVWSPLAGGALTGKFGPGGEPPPGSRRTSFDVGPVDFPRANRALAVAREIAAREGGSVPQVALAWLLAQDVVTSVILGAKRPSQLEDNLGATSIQLTAQDLQRLDEATALPVEYPGWYLKQFAGV